MIKAMMADGNETQRSDHMELPKNKEFCIYSVECFFHCEMFKKYVLC
ncbi:MAG: hypothetical protein LBC02_04960 [Planctomycetaceae bacterium]|nr:hypothetical protein [Planctomycetaceae bacterium]